MNEIVKRIDTLSFLLGFNTCVLLYYLRPGLISIFGGIISFIKIFIIFGIGIGSVIFVLKSHQQRQINDPVVLEETPKKVNDDLKGNEKVHDDLKEDVREYKYFPIPITKLSDSEKLVPSHTPHVENAQKVSVTESDNKYDKTLRYENFVKMASKRGEA